MIGAADEFVAYIEVLREAQQVLPKVRFLAERDRNDLSARELVVELLLRLHWLCRAKCVRMRDGWKIREQCRGREAGPASLRRCCGVAGRDAGSASSGSLEKFILVRPTSHEE